jgi:hypothetical protein
VSQIQYWGPFGSGRHTRLLGNLSVDIGSWRAASGYRDPNAMERDAIAVAVQAQLRDSFKRFADAMIGPTFYHLDDFIGFVLGPDPKDPTAIIMHPQRNHAPFLINVVDDWKNRPRGEPWNPSTDAAITRAAGQGQQRGDVWWPTSGGYPVHFGNLVVAGTHLRTFTRLGTMESANESARHAVNTILDHAALLVKPPGDDPDEPSSRPPEPKILPTVIRRDAEPARPGLTLQKGSTPFGDYCDIWNPELYEFPDLEFLRLIDSYLMQASTARAADDAPKGSPPVAPHLFDILRLDELPDWIDDDATALGAFELLGSALKAFETTSLGDVPSILKVVDQVRKKLAHLFDRSTR